MNMLFSTVPALLPLMLLAVGFVPSVWANRHIAIMRRVVMVLACLGCCLSTATTILLIVNGPMDIAYLTMTWPLPVGFGVYIDNVAAMMLLLITFNGFIICRFSLRYLDGEATQGRFLRWISFSLGAVLLLVVSRNLVMLTAAWMLTSLGLHQLLVHYPDRTWAIWAARKKFLVSRLGDVMLLAALVLTFWKFGSSEYADVFAAANALQSGKEGSNSMMSLIGILFVLGAMSKSAQFPFHSWLPDTMETPTPVSALMHAGIINAGGFLVIRLSPLIIHSNLALDLLTLVGGFTALFGGVVMLTQTSMKRSLAYSTISQMGFMMLQCGLGAFSAAMLHIIAHSVYKAHAFLSSGSVLESAARMRTDSSPTSTLTRRLLTLPIAIVAAFGLCLSPIWLIGVGAEAGHAVLGVVLVVAITQLIWNGLSSGKWKMALQSVLSGALIVVSYYAAFVTIDHLMGSSVPQRTISHSILDVVVFGMVAFGFISIGFLQTSIHRLSHLSFVRALYVHAMNGFYLDVPARRLTAYFWGQSAPVQ